MSALAGPLLDQLVNALRNPATAGDSTEQLSIAVTERWIETVDALKGILWIDAQVHGAWLWSQSRARQIGKDLEQIAGDQDWLWHHLTEVILPHTESYLVGYIFSHGIVPLRREIAEVQKSIRFLMGWRGQIDYWRKRQVDPQLAAWHQFSVWFDRNARQPIQTVAQWLKTPGSFSRWAVPVLASPLVDYLATKADARTADELARLVVDHTPDVWRYVEAAAAAILNTEV